MSGKKGRKKLDRRAALARIHVCKKELGLDEVTYREMLAGITGKDSCAKMTDAQLRAVLDHLSRFVPPHRKKTRANRAPQPGEPGGDLGRDQNMRIVYAKARRVLGPDWRRRLTGLCEKIAGKSAPEWCTNRELVQLMAAVGKIGRRENVPEKPQDQHQ